MDSYGMELSIDLEDADPNTFNRQSLTTYFTRLCDLIRMEKCEVHFWDDYGVPEEDRQTNPKTKGTSAVCFILTSTIVIHTLDDLRTVFVNIFSCKEFNGQAAMDFTEQYFKGKTAKYFYNHRGVNR